MSSHLTSPISLSLSLSAADIGYGNYVLTAPGGGGGGGDKSPSSRKTREMRFGNGRRKTLPDDEFEVRLRH